LASTLRRRTSRISVQRSGYRSPATPFAAYVHVLANDDPLWDGQLRRDQHRATHAHLEINPPLGAASIPANPAIQPGQTQRFTAAMTAKGIYSWQCGEREDAQDDDEFGNLLVQ
jgi:hypothetical protein